MRPGGNIPHRLQNRHKEFVRVLRSQVGSDCVGCEACQRVPLRCAGSRHRFEHALGQFRQPKSSEGPRLTLPTRVNQGRLQNARTHALPRPATSSRPPGLPANEQPSSAPLLALPASNAAPQSRQAKPSKKLPRSCTPCSTNELQSTTQSLARQSGDLDNLIESRGPKL